MLYVQIISNTTLLITPGNKAIKYIKLYTYILLNTPDKEIMIQDKRK